MTRAKQKKPDQIKLPMDRPRDLLAGARRVICNMHDDAFQTITDWRERINSHKLPTTLSLWNLGQAIQNMTASVVRDIEFLRIIAPVEACATAPDTSHLALRDMLTMSIKVWTQQALSGDAVRCSTSMMWNLVTQEHYLALLKAISTAEAALLELTDTKE